MAAAKQNGFTIVEAIIAMVVIVCTVLTFAAGLRSAERMHGHINDASAAAQIADNDISFCAAENINGITVNDSTYSIFLNGKNWIVTRRIGNKFVYAATPASSPEETSIIVSLGTVPDAQSRWEFRFVQHPVRNHP